jgi:cation:H+ antiporter
MTWLLLFFASTVIVLAGSRLARYGDMLAEKTHMGTTWTGAVLVAATTSVPELFTGLSSAAIFRLPDIAVGDVLGSCMFNLFILSLMDAVAGEVSISSRAQQGHALSIGFGMILAGLVGMSFSAGPRIPALGWVGLYTPGLIMVYLLAMRTVFRYEKRRLLKEQAEVAEDLRYGAVSTRTVCMRYALYACLVVLAAIFLPEMGEKISHETGLQQSFVGTLFIAVATSLPEVVVSIAAVRIGAIDLAVGNVLGSNLFNMLILALDDAAYTPGPILTAASPSHLIAVLAVLLMYGIGLVGLTYQAIHKRLGLAWDTWAILAVYIGALLLYLRNS